MKKVCKVCHRTTLNNDYRCDSCTAFRKYVECQPQKIKEISILPFLHFDFHPHGLALIGKSVNADILGSVQVDLKTGIAHVRISLYEFKDMLSETCFSECLRVIIHETQHWCLYETTKDMEIMSHYDNLDYRELEEWLNE